MPINLHTFVRALESVLPPSTAMKGDRLGLQLQSGRSEISSVLITMELTDEVAEEAVQSGTDCIISFHPLIFAPLTALTDTERVGRICTRLITNNIALVVAHTNFDAYEQGTNMLLAKQLELYPERALVPSAENIGFGMGIVASLQAPERLERFVERVYAITFAPVRFSSGKKPEIQRVALVGGSGASFIDDALRAEVDAFITADIKYHDFHRTQGIMALIDAGHYEMEQFVPQGLENIIRDISTNTGASLVITRSQTLPNPVMYFPHPQLYQDEHRKRLRYKLS